MRPDERADQLWRAHFSSTRSQTVTHMHEVRARAGIAHVPTFSQPYFLDAAVRPLLARTAELMTGALRTVGRELLLKGRFRDHFALSDEKWRLSLIDAGRADPCGFWRFDVLFDRDTRALKFLECNGGDPSGAAWTDVLLEGFMQLPAWKALEEHMTLHADHLGASHRAATSRRAQGPVLFVCARDSFVRNDHECMAAYYRRKGVKADVADPRDIAWRDGRPLVDGEPAAVVVRDTIDEFVLAPHAESAALLVRAYEQGAFAMLNPLCGVYSDLKGALDVMSDPANAALFRDDERHAISEHLPVSRRLTPELRDDTRARRTDRVLKPCDGYGGFGVLVGRETPEAEWERALTNPDLLVQDYVPIPQDVFALDSVDGEVAAPRKVTLSLWVHDGKYVGSFARASSQSVINVHQGGGIVPVVFVE